MAAQQSWELLNENKKKNLNCLLQTGIGRGRRDKRGLHDMKDQEQYIVHQANEFGI